MKIIGNANLKSEFWSHNLWTNAINQLTNHRCEIRCIENIFSKSVPFHTILHIGSNSFNKCIKCNSVILRINRDVLFEFHLKFWNTASIGIPVRSLLKGRQTSKWFSCSTEKQLLDGVQIKHLYPFFLFSCPYIIWLSNVLFIINFFFEKHLVPLDTMEQLFH